MTGEETRHGSVSYVGELVQNPTDDVLLVENDTDFVRACVRMSAGDLGGVGPTVWVRIKNHWVWLRDFAEQIGNTFDFKEMTACLLLAEKWNVWLPDWLTDHEVIDQSLLELEVDGQQGKDSFTGRLLTHLLDPVFKADSLKAANLTDLIKKLVEDNSNGLFTQYPVLRKCLEIKCKEWADNASEPWERVLSSQLCQNADQLWHRLSLWANLNSYPQKLLEFVLTPEQVLFVKQIPVLALEDLPIEPSARDQALTQIELFFGEIEDDITSTDGFQSVVQMTSGRLLKEFDLIFKILKSKRFVPNKEDIRITQEKFKHCPGLSGIQLKRLDNLIVPDRPALLTSGEEWNSDQWIRWTVEEYVPYRSWQVENASYDEDLERTVIRFTDWYTQEYPSIHNNADLSLVHCLRNLSSERSKEDLSIVLLIDCLPVAFMPLIEDALRNVGLSRHDLRYRFAALPTITECNKAALLSEEWEDYPSTYEAILKKRGETDWKDRPVIYLNSLKAMSEMTVPTGPGIVILNFVDGDELFHSDIESTNTTYEEELHRLFSRVAESVARLSTEWSGAPENFNIYVTTDHGACRILEEEKRSFDSTVVNRLFPDEKYRYAKVVQAQVGDIPDNLWALGYRFKQPFVSDDKIYFLPKGHNTVRKSGRAKGYVHGGATPEEVIVPTATFKLVGISWKLLGARFLELEPDVETGRAKFFVQRVVPLNIEIQNPNIVDIAILRASVTSPKNDIKSCEVPIISAGRTDVLRMSCYFDQSALNETNLEIEIEYEISGEQRTHPLRLECEFKSAMSSGFNLRDL